MNDKQQLRGLFVALVATGFLASVFFATVNISELKAGVLFSWFGDEITSPSTRNDELLNPKDYNLPESAVEVFEKRTAQTATFETSPGKFAAVGIPDYLFAKDEQGNWVIANDIGKQDGNFFVFNRLKGGIKASFDLNYPRYILEKDDYWVSIGFSVPTGATIKDHQTISYQLSDYVNLEWQVKDNQIEKRIRIDKPGPLSKLAFTITKSDNLKEESIGNRLVYKDWQGSIIFSTKAPILTDLEGNIYSTPINLSKQDEWFYYDYSANDLAYPYIIDPSAGPNSGATPGSDSSIGTEPWSNGAGALTSGDASEALVFFAVTTPAGGFVSEYLTVTDFGFAIPVGAEIDGIDVEWIRKADSEEPDSHRIVDNAVRIIKNGSIGSTDKSEGVLWPSTLQPATYGDSADTWGESWTHTNINASNFGAALSVQSSTAVDDGVYFAFVDHVRITVYYTGGDTTPPVIAEVTPVTTPAEDTTPNYTFSSDEAGTISYGGDCSSVTTSAASASNNITFNALAVGVHSNCTIVVTDASSNPSNTLNVSSFEITAPAEQIVGDTTGGGETDDIIKNKLVSLTGDAIFLCDEYYAKSPPWFFLAAPSATKLVSADPFNKLLDLDHLPVSSSNRPAPLVMFFPICAPKEMAPGALNVSLEIKEEGATSFTPIANFNQVKILEYEGDNLDLPPGVVGSLAREVFAIPARRSIREGKYISSGNNFKNSSRLFGSEVYLGAVTFAFKESGEYEFRLSNMRSDGVKERVGFGERAWSVNVEEGVLKIAEQLGVPAEALKLPKVDGAILKYWEAISRALQKKDVTADEDKESFVYAEDSVFNTIVVDNLRVIGPYEKHGLASINLYNDKIITGGQQSGIIFGHGNNSTFSFSDAVDADDLVGKNNLLTITDNGDTADLWVSGGATLEGDFTIKDASGNTRLFVGGNGRIGIGTDSPNTKFQVYENGPFTSSYGSFVSNPIHAPGFELRKARGTITAPEAIEISDDVGRVFFQGYAGNNISNTGFTRMAMLDVESIDVAVNTGSPATSGIPARFNFWVYGKNDQWLPRMTLEPEKVIFANDLEVAGQVRIMGGSPGEGKVLTSDANGLARWETLAARSGTEVTWGNITGDIIDQIDLNIVLDGLKITDITQIQNRDINDLTGTLSINRGGTGLTAVGEVGQVLTVGSDGTLVWTTPQTSSAAESTKLASFEVEFDVYNDNSEFIEIDLSGATPVVSTSYRSSLLTGHLSNSFSSLAPIFISAGIIHSQLRANYINAVALPGISSTINGAKVTIKLEKEDWIGSGIAPYGKIKVSVMATQQP